MKKHETIADDPPVPIYMNKIKNRIVFEIKTGCKLELLTKETTQLLGSEKKRYWSKQKWRTCAKIRDR